MQLSALKLYSRPQLITILLLGFSSGLPLALTASTLGIWLTEAGVTKAAIGLFAAIGTPYALKFLWAPLMDQLPIPYLTKRLGRRRGWMLVTQTALVLSLIGLGASEPSANAWNTALWALLVAIASASQDIVVDAYRVERLSTQEQGAGAAANTIGYRIGMLVASAGALVLAEYYGWQVTYLVMAALISVGIVTTLFSPEPKKSRPPKVKGMVLWIKQAVISPFADFMQHHGWLVILLFVVFYKLGDALAGVMTGPFLIDIGFSKTEIAAIVKTFGLVATLLGTVIGGVMVSRFGLYRSLLFCGIFQMFSNLMFAVQAMVGHDPFMLAVTISIENLASGMGSAAFVAYLSSLCNIAYTATQYALLSSLAATGRTWLSASAGFMAEGAGWIWFFGITTIAAIPGLVLLYALHRRYKSDKL